MHFIALVVSLCLLLGSCSEPKAPHLVTNKPIPNATQIAQELQRYSRQTNQVFLGATQALVKANQNFLNDPSEANLARAQEQWLEAHRAYTQTHFGLLLPVDQIHLLDRLDAWPIQPGFIDNLEQYPVSGLIYDESLVISKDMLRNQHQITDSEEVAIGFHAIELLLFTRPVSDFSSDGTSQVDRRRLTLQLMTELLEEDASLVTETSMSFIEAADAELVLATFLDQTLSTLRSIFREGNLVAAQGAGHSLDRNRSLKTLSNEILALKRYTIEEVALAEAFRTLDEATLHDFVITIDDAQQIIEASASDEMVMANVPLVISALTHQIEDFQKALR